MPRTLLTGLSLAILAACAGPDQPVMPTPSIVIGEGLDQLGDPRWSPDGTRIAYSRQVEGRAAIFVTNADGSNPVRVTHGVWDQAPIWSPDGQWIAYYSDEGGDIYVVPSTGGERRQVTSGPAADSHLGWTADGSGLVIERIGEGNTTTFVAPVDGGPIRVLGAMPDASINAAISPDGSRLLMEVEREGQHTIWVQQLPDGAPRQLTTEGFEDPHTPWAWSPDSRSILYESRRTGTGDLWILDAETGQQRQLTTDIRDDVSGRWSPDGRWVMFVSNRGGQPDLWAVPAAGGEAVRLTNDPLVEDEPSWSPDGASVLFRQTDVASRIAVLPVNGGAPGVVLDWGRDFVESVHPSPDGSQVAFVAVRGGNQDLWMVPAAGGTATSLASSPASDGWPQWSPDGTQLVFVSGRGGTADLWIVPAGGGEARRLTEWSPANETEPRWSPDGSRIAFLSNRDASTPEIWTVAADGGSPTRVTTGAAVLGLVWSQDGREIFFTGTAPRGARGFHAVPAGGGATRALLDGVVAAVSPRLSPDGAHLAYINLSAGPGWGFLEVVPVAGGTPRRLTTQTEMVYQTSPAWSADGSQLVVEEFDFPSSGQLFSVVTWPGGEWRRLPRNERAFMLGPKWAPDGNSIVYQEVETIQRIVGLPVGNLLPAQ